MSALDRIRYLGGNTGAASPGYVPTDLAQGTGASFRDVQSNLNFDAEWELTKPQREERDRIFQEKTGIKVRRIAAAPRLDPKYGEILDDNLMGGKYVNLPEHLDVQKNPQSSAIEDNFFTAQKSKIPDLAGLKLNSDIKQNAITEAKKKRTEAESVLARNPSAASRTAASLLGGIGATLTDDLTIATLPIGAGETKLAGVAGWAAARAIAMQAAKEGVIQAGITAAATPKIADWQAQVGHKYGLSEAAMDIGFGFAGGASVRFAAEGFMPAVRATSRGAKQVSAYALDTIAKKAPNISQSVRDSLNYMSRSAYIDDAIPTPPKNTADILSHRRSAQKVADDVNSYKRPAPELPGVSKIVTPRNELELEVRGVLVELDDLITSDKQGFDQSLQPRDRSNRIASDVRINEIAARLDAAQLGDSRVSNTGAPIVGPDMMVESGNGRVMALRKVYDAHPENAEKYRAFLKAQGYNPEGMKRPVLVRQRISELTSEQRKQFVIFSNEDVADRLSLTERAMADARLMTPDVLKAYEGGDVGLVKNQKFVRNFINTAVSPAERNAFLSPSGELSQEGLKRIRAAMLARAYSDSDLVQKILEDADTNIKTIGNVLMDISGDWANMRLDIKQGEKSELYDLTADLMDAVKVIIHARQTNKPISDFTGTSSLFAETKLSAETLAILKGMYDDAMIKPLGYDKVHQFLRYYLDEVAKIDNTPKMFAMDPIDPINILSDFLKRQGKSLSADISSGRKRVPLKNTSATDAPTAQALPSQTSDVAPPSAFGRKRAMTPPSKRTGVVSTRGNIDIPSSITVYQKVKNLSTITRLAQELKPELEAFLSYITDGIEGAKVYGVRIKETESLNLKFGRGKNLDQVSDYLGGRIVAESQQALDQVLQRLREAGNIIEVDNFLDAGKPSGYRAIHVQAMSDKGLSVEIQIQPAPIRAVQDAAHIVYKKWQNDTTVSAEKLADMQQAKQLFDDAWADWQNKTNPAEPFDTNAYRLREYKEAPVIPPSEIKPSERFAANQERFAALSKENPDMMITLDDGSSVRLADYAARMKEDEKVLEALTTCMVA